MTAAEDWPFLERILTVFVAGRPAPQGSKDYIGRGRMVESSKYVKPWRKTIGKDFQNEAGEPRIRFVKGEAVFVSLTFVMPRPKRMPKTRATLPHTGKPDIDKLERAVLDALTQAGVLADDSQVVYVTKRKRYAELNEPAGCEITIALDGKSRPPILPLAS